MTQSDPKDENALNLPESQLEFLETLGMRKDVERIFSEAAQQREFAERQGANDLIVSVTKYHEEQVEANYRPIFEGNLNQLTILLEAIDKRDSAIWNRWRSETHENINLRGANLQHRNLENFELHWADLADSNLNDANLSRTNLFCAHLDHIHCVRAKFHEAKIDCASMTSASAREADFSGSIIHSSNLSGSNLSSANFARAHIDRANLNSALLGESRFILTVLTNSDLQTADLSRAMLVDCDISGSNFTGATVYGVSAWDLVTNDHATMQDLVITRKDQSQITVDSMEIAQFMHLLLNNDKVRNVIDTIVSKVVLILGRFTPERKPILDSIRAQLRKRNYLPVLFDFQKPASRDLTETISTLGHLARFIIADITDAKSIPQELERLVPHLPSVPVQPVLLATQHEYGMFEHFRRYPWVLEPVLYDNQQTLMDDLEVRIIEPAIRKTQR